MSVCEREGGMEREREGARERQGSWGESVIR